MCPQGTLNLKKDILKMRLVAQLRKDLTNCRASAIPVIMKHFSQ